MAQFSYNDYLNAFVGKVYGSQNLCKLLYYDYSNPLSQPDIPDTTILHTDEENQRILFSPFTLNVDDSRMTKLAIMVDFIDVGDIDYFRTVTIDCLLAVHNNLWELDSSEYVTTRPLLIWDELELLFNQKYISGVGKDKTSIGNLIYFNDKYTGYKISYHGCNLPPK